MPSSLASLADVDAAAAAVFESLPPGALLAVATQASPALLGRLQEERLRCRWEQRSQDNQRSVAGGGRRRWTDGDEAALRAAAAECATGVLFLAEKPLSA